jgi:hypothetical protein
MVSVHYNDVAQFIVNCVPEFVQEYRKHLEFNEGEILNHVLMGDLVLFAAKVCSKPQEAVGKTQDDLTLVTHIVECVESLANSDDPLVVELVQTSFMENLHIAGDRYETIRKLLRTKSLKLLENAESFWLKEWLEEKKIQNTAVENDEA